MDSGGFEYMCESGHEPHYWWGGGASRTDDAISLERPGSPDACIKCGEPTVGHELGAGWRCAKGHLTPLPTETILQEATRVVDGARQSDYGDPRENHGRTAAMWSGYLGILISPRQVCMMNVLQKCSRDAHKPKRDNLVDVAGWARNAEMCENE